MAMLDGLRAEVARNTSVADSIVVLLNGIAEKLANAPTPEEVLALSAEIKATSDKMAEAVIAHTPAEPPPA